MIELIYEERYFACKTIRVYEVLHIFHVPQPFSSWSQFQAIMPQQ